MSNYLFELAVIHTALILGYFLLLRKEHQYAKMRFYLLGSTLLALVIPLFNIPIPSFKTISATPINVVSLDALTAETGSINQISMSTMADFSPWDFLIWPYLFISGFLLLRFSKSVLYLLYLERRSMRETINHLNIRKVRNIQGSFTFFNWIFLSDEIHKSQHDYEVILKHEKAHASLGHTYDLMFFELFKICFWWLPTTWFIITEIKKIHEYQADADVLQWCPVDQYSSILINATLKSTGLNLASSFHDGFILKRITAMKQKETNVSVWKLGILTTLCVSLFLVFACSQETKSDIVAEVFSVVEEQPEFVGGMDAFYDYVRSEIRYPIEARQSGVEGQVNVQFVVDKDGSLSGVKVLNGIGAGCDREAERVLKNAPLFKPGKQRGKALRVQMAMPIIFKLDHGKTNADNSTQGMIVVKEVELKKSNLKIDANYANGEWSGTVHDEDGKGLPGANIVVAGTNAGTVSDLDGTFTVKANESNELHISYVGYEIGKLGSK